MADAIKKIRESIQIRTGEGLGASRRNQETEQAIRDAEEKKRKELEKKRELEEFSERARLRGLKTEAMLKQIDEEASTGPGGYLEKKKIKSLEMPPAPIQKKKKKQIADTKSDNGDLW